MEKSAVSRPASPFVTSGDTARGRMAIAFDLDGTLVDSAPDIHRSVCLALSGEGKLPLPFGVVKCFIGNGVELLIRRTMEASGLAGEHIHERMVACFLADYNHAPTALTRCFPAVEATLSWLAVRGHPLAICTNKPEATARAILQNLGIMGHFQAVIGGDTLKYRKPEPQPLNAAFRRLGAQGGIYVGDSETDAETAARALVPFFLFTEGYRRLPVERIPYHFAFADFAILPDLVAGHDSIAAP